MKKYEAWFQTDPSSLENRIEVVEAESEKGAYRAAKELVREGEFIRGVAEIDEDDEVGP